MVVPCQCLQARLAQSAERKALNLVVVGSSPTVGVALSFREGREGTVLWCVSPKRSQAVSVTSQCLDGVKGEIDNANKTPTVGLEPTTTRLRALRSAD